MFRDFRDRKYDLALGNTSASSNILSEMGIFQSKPKDITELIPRSPDMTRVVAAKFAANEELKNIAKELAEAGIAVFYPQLGSVSEDPVLNKGYHDARARAFSYVDAGYPYLIIQPKNAQEVARAMKCASRLKGTVPICINGGGHSAQCMRTESIVFVMKYLNAVRLDREGKRVIAGGGCKIGEVDQVCRGTGLGYVTGTNLDTGVTGLCLVGGVGFLSRKHGMACDQILEAEVALADGTLVRADDANEHKDLMRALRGGSSNFGIVTEITLELVPVGTCFGGILVNITPTKASCLTLARAWHQHVQTNFPLEAWSGFVFLGRMPVNPMLCAYVSEGVTAAPPPAFTQLAELPGSWAVLNRGTISKPKDYHSDLQSMLTPFGLPGYYVQSGFYVPTIDDALLEALWKFGRQEAPSSKCAIVVVTIGECGWRRRRVWGGIASD